DVGLGCELFQRAGMNQRRTGGTRQRIRRQVGAAAGAVRRRQAGAEAGAAPTRYGPRICNQGAPVILQACFMPMKMINALMRPDGNDPTTTRTGRAAMKADRNTNPRRRPPALGFVAARLLSVVATSLLFRLVVDADAF